MSMDKLAIKLNTAPKTTGLRPSNVNTKAGPRTRIVYSKPIKINHGQVFSKYKIVERIARNTVVIISSFYRCKHPDAKDLFDDYISSVIDAQKESVANQKAELVKALKQAEQKGFKFDLQGNPATIDIVISNPHVHQVAELLVNIDENIDMLTKLSVIDLINDDVYQQHEKFALYCIDYIDKSLTVLLQRLNKEFSFKPNKSVSKNNTSDVDFTKIKAFLKELHSDASTAVTG